MKSKKEMKVNLYAELFCSQVISEKNQESIKGGGISTGTLGFQFDKSLMSQP